MKRRNRFILVMLISGLMSSCGALPTLPPLDSTVTVRTPRFVEITPTENEFLTPTIGDTILPPSLTPTPTQGQFIKTSTPQITETELPVTKTLTVTSEPKETSTPTRAPSMTSTPTNTPVPSLTPTPFPYGLQLMNPNYLSNFTHQDLGCDWLGIAGQIFDQQGLVQKDIVIRAGGTIQGTPIVEDMTMPLTEPDIDLAYGPGGFELTLANSPANTEDTAWIQLFNMEGDPLSDKIFLITYDDCLKNLILMNFIEQ